MNINFGTDNFYVRYLKRFLNHELKQGNAVLGEFTVDDLALLIKYLNLPNVKDMFEVQSEIEELFPELKNNFNAYLGSTSIKWTSKEISENISNFLIDNVDNIKEYCETVGWEYTDVEDWMDTSKDINSDGYINALDQQILQSIIYDGKEYDENIMKRADVNLDGKVDEEDLDILNNYIQTGRFTLTITKEDRENYFPNKDMLVFVNQFTGWFLYNYAIRDNIGVDDLPHTNTTEVYKLAVYECYPGQKLTIAHNNNKATRLVIGSSSAVLKQDITSTVLKNVVDITLSPRRELSIHMH